MIMKREGLLWTFVLLITTVAAEELPRKFNDDVNGNINAVTNGYNKEIQCDNGHVMITNSFTWVDYLVLAIMLIVSCGIGIFYGFFGEKHSSSDDFLLGGSSMGTFPMAMSLTASFITAIELLGNPAEVYSYGTQYWLICVSFLFVIPLTSKLYLPVFMKLRLTSSYEYFQMRFNSQVRYIASGLYILQMILYASVAVYAPALALSHVTGLNVYLAVTIVYVVCIFYASQGGMKAVIMTDTFQAAILIGSLLVIMYLGEHFVGGSAIIWYENFKADRLQFLNFDTDPTIRHSFWSVTLGGTFYWLTMYNANQASIQKYLSVENIKQVRKALWVSCFGLIIVFTINFYTGMILVTEYRNCDPLKSGDVTAGDEMLPLYVMMEMGHLKGVAGFFVAGIFAASLGTVATALNSLAACTCQDFITGLFKFKLDGSKGAMYAKWISIIYGVISFGLIFVVEQLGSVIQVAISFNGMVGGVILGLFSLGMFFPWANTKGAIFGSSVALALVLWMGLGQQISIANGSYRMATKPVNIDHCPCLNVTNYEENVTHNDEDVFFLYRISFLWYSGIGFIVTVLLGIIGSLITGPNNPKDIDEDLISPAICDMLKSLPIELKKSLNLPHETDKIPKDINLKGIVNVTLNMNDEEPIKHSSSRADDNNKFRKISTISVNF